MTARIATGIDWIGEMPQHWRLKPLKHIADFANGMAFKPSDWTQNGTPIIRIENLNGGDDFNCYLGHVEPRYIVGRGDLLFGWSGNRGTSFGPFVWMKDGEFYLNQHIFKVGAKGCSPRWLYWCLKAVTHYVEEEAHGIIGMVHVTKGKLGAIKVPVPSWNEQRWIADFLDRETAKIDALIAKQTEFLTLLDEHRRALVTEAVTKGLDPSVPMKEAGSQVLPAIPAHWKLVRLRHLASVQHGLALGRKTEQPTTEVPYLRVANVQDGYLDLDEIKTVWVTEEELHRHGLQAGDVLMNEGGDNDKLGRGAIWDGSVAPCVHQNHVFAVRPHGVEPEWLTLVTGADYAKRFFETRAKQSTNLASISSTNLKEVPIVLPPPGERKDVLDFLAASSSKIIMLKASTDETIRLLRERRSALITAAVTGQINVTHASAVPEAA